MGRKLTAGLKAKVKRSVNGQAGYILASYTRHESHLAIRPFQQALYDGPMPLVGGPLTEVHQGHKKGSVS